MFFFVKAKRIRTKHKEERRILTEFEEEMLKIDIKKGGIKRELKIERKRIQDVNALVREHNTLVGERNKLAGEGTKAKQELDDLVTKRMLGDGVKANELSEVLKNRAEECELLDKQLITLRKQIKEKEKKVKK